jgi:hypothetical protein
MPPSITSPSPNPSLSGGGFGGSAQLRRFLGFLVLLRWAGCLLRFLNSHQAASKLSGVSTFASYKGGPNITLNLARFAGWTAPLLLAGAVG